MAHLKSLRSYELIICTLEDVKENLLKQLDAFNAQRIINFNLK